MRTPHGDNHDIWINPHDGNIMIQSNDGGANVSTDGGRTWSTQMNQPTGEIYGVWMDDQFPYKLYGAQQDDDTVIIASNAESVQPDDWQRGPGCETGPIMPHPGNPEHRLRVVQGAVRRDGPEDRTGEELLDRRAVALRQPGERSDLSLPARVADGDVAVRSERAVLRLAVPAPHARQGRDVGEDLAGSDRAPRVLPGRERRAHHARRDRRGVLQHALRDRRVADSRRA